MNALVIIGSIIAVIAYFPLWREISLKQVEQNLLTWILWFALDIIITITIIFQNGSFLLTATYTVGSLITAILICKSKSKISWTWFESFVTALVTTSMIIWYFSGDKAATVTATAAMLIAGIPQLVDAYKNPHGMPLLVYGAYMIANSFSLAGAADWSVKERLYPASALIYCLLIFIFSIRKFWIKPAAASTN